MTATAAEPERYRIEIKRVRRGLAHPLQTGGGRSIAVRESVLLKVTAAADPARTGYGEAAPLPWFGTESADEAAAALAALGKALRLERSGRPAVTALSSGAPASGTVAAEGEATGRLWPDALERVLPRAAARALSAAPCARFALECALRQAGALPPLPPFANAFACAGNPAAVVSPPGQSAAVAQDPTASGRVVPALGQSAAASAQDPTASAQGAVVGAGLPVAIPVAALLPAGSVAVPHYLLTAGFRVFKIKIGVRAFADEAASVGALLTFLRQAATVATGKHADATAQTPGPADKTAATAALSRCPFRLRLDANASLPASGLYAWLRLLDPFADLVDFIEQPLRVGQEQQTAAAFAGSALAFAFDESLTSLPQLRRISEQFPQAVLVVKPALLGSAAGFSEWRRHNARTQLPVPHRVVYSSALETGIGLHHALSLAAADPLPLEPVGFGTGGLFAQDGLGAPPQRAATIVFNPERFAAGGAVPHAAAVAKISKTAAVRSAVRTTAVDSSAAAIVRSAAVPAAAGGTAGAQGLREPMEALWRRA